MSQDFRTAIFGVVIVFTVVVAAVVALTIFGPADGTATTITAIIGVAGVVLGPLLALLAQMQRVVRTVEIVHNATNSMKDELVASTAKASRSEGVAEGRADERLNQEFDRDRRERQDRQDRQNGGR
jgi:hypothetical protein